MASINTSRYARQVQVRCCRDRSGQPAAATILTPPPQGINATAKIIETMHSKVDVGRVLNMQAFKLENVLKMEPNFLQVPPPPSEDPASFSPLCPSLRERTTPACRCAT